MKISGSPALLTAQLYASTASQLRDGAAAQAQRRQQPKFEVKDEVAIRADRVEDRTPAVKASADDGRSAALQARADKDEGVGRREAPIEKPAFKKPGSLVNLTA